VLDSHPDGVGVGPGQVDLRNVQMVISIPVIYVLILTVAWFKRVMPKDDAEPPLAVLDTSEKFIVNVNKVIVRFHLPEDVEAKAQFVDIEAAIGNWGKKDREGVHKLKVSVQDISLFVPSADVEPDSFLESDDDWNRLLNVRKSSLVVRHVKEDHCDKVNTIDLVVGKLCITVPHRYEVCNIVEAFLKTKKCVKFLNHENFGYPSEQEIKDDDADIPTINLDIGSFSLSLLDDPLEIHLSRNYKVGLKEQIGRIKRAASFLKKANQLRNARRAAKTSDAVFDESYSPSAAFMYVSYYLINRLRGEDDVAEIETAWWLLQEFDSDSYVKKIAENPTTDPPLLVIEWTGIVGTIRGPRPGVLPGATIEESLHKMDASTPIDQKYDMLHPREICIAATCYSARMRDYSFPIFDLPGTGVMGQKAWKTTGYIIVAEQFALDVSILLSRISVSPLPYDAIRVEKTINAVKIYMNLETSVYVSSGSSFRLRYERFLVYMIGGARILIRL
jgi:hypothetical protein